MLCYERSAIFDLMQTRALVTEGLETNFMFACIKLAARIALPSPGMPLQVGTRSLDPPELPLEGGPTEEKSPH